MTNKLFAAICAIGMFLIISLVFTVASISRNLLFQNAKILLDNQAKQTVHVFDQYMNILQNTVMTASRQSSIQGLIHNNYTGFGSYLVYRDSYAYLKNIHEFYDWIHIYVFVEDLHYIMSSNPEDVVGDYGSKGVNQAKWYKEVADSPGGIAIRPDFIPPASSLEEHFAYVLKVRNVYTWNTDGFIIAAINKTILKDLFNGTSLENDGFMLVLTEDGEIAYNSDPSLFERHFSIEQIRRELDDGNNYHIDRNRSFYYSSWKSQTTGWNFIIFADMTHAQRQITNFLILVLMIALFTIVLLIGAARFTAKTYLKPVRRLIHFIHKVEENEFSEQIDLKSDDEMGELVNSFNSMIVSVRQNQILRKKAQIYALQKQINPHFLFNTFASIKSLAQENRMGSVVSMIEKLSDIFHYNTNRNGTFMPSVYEEIDHIRNYLDIQRVRFGDRLEISYSIDPEILKYRMPRIILQPIVENSISHSMEQMKCGYRLYIQGYVEDEDIVFTIGDNGIGIPADKLMRLKRHIFGLDTANDHKFGIGLKNIHERLLLSYGEGYGLTIESSEGQYTEICVRIPKMDKNKEENQ